MKRRTTAVAFVAACALVASACGGDDSDAAPTTTQAPGAATATSAGGAAASTCKVDAKIKLVALFEKKGESVNAIDDFNDGASMAVEEINAKGGVCGQTIDFERLPASPTDANQAKNQYLSALDKKAHLIMGPISSTVAIPLAPEVRKNPQPIMIMSVAPQLLKGAEAGADNLFMIRPRNTAIANLQVEYFVKDLNKKNIGLVCVEQPFGQQGCDAATKKIEELGGKVVGRETNATTAQDLTTQLLSLKSKNVDAIITFNFPNPLVVLANQAADNGLNVPIMGGSSSGIAVASGSIKANALTNLYGTDDCAPAGDPAAKAFADAYQKKYNKGLPGSGYAVAEAYDTVYIAAEAVKKANSLDGKKLTEALSTMVYKGICDEYKNDAQNNMHDGQVIEQFDSKGIPQIKKTLVLAA